MNLVIFRTESLFANIDHLFWKVSPELEDHQFAWILWYIWKGRNIKVFSNLDVDPSDTFKLAETESLLWAEAQSSLTQGIDQNRLPVSAIISCIPDRWCFTNGSWKNKKFFRDKGDIAPWKVLMV